MTVTTSFTTPVVSYTTVGVLYVMLPAIGSKTNVTSSELLVFGAQAQTIVNAKIGKRYALPLTNVVPLLETITTDIALYRFLSLRVFTQESKNKSEWPEKYKETMGLLDDIADGTMPLITNSGSLLSQSETSNEAWSNTMDYAPSMTDDNTLNQIDDIDKLNDIKDARA